ncbi:unnamed protein product, partial [Didymodactylos carnosus]
VIDRTNQDETRVHIYGTIPIHLVYVIEPDRFGSFIGLAINTSDNILMILHSKPAYMITIQEIQYDQQEHEDFNIVDIGSVRAVHGPVLNQMTKCDVVPHAFMISFCPKSNILFCVSGEALFKTYVIRNQIVEQEIVHFRPEFYTFMCHAWLDENSILDVLEMIKDETFVNMLNEATIASQQQQLRISGPLYDGSIVSAQNISYLDIAVSDQLLPYFICTYQEYFLVFAPIQDEPYFDVIYRHQLISSNKHHNEIFDVNKILKISSIWEFKTKVYLLTDRNNIFCYYLTKNTDVNAEQILSVEEDYIYGFHSYSVNNIGLGIHKSWLISMGGDNMVRIIDYKDNSREIISKSIREGAYSVSGADPYCLHVVLGGHNRLQLYLITNYELRMVHQFEARGVKELNMSQCGHLIAAIMNNSVQIYSTITLRLLSQLRGHVGKIKQAVWSKNDSTLTTAGSDGMICIWNVFNGMRVGEVITKQFHYLGIAVTSDNSKMYAIASDASIKVFSSTNLENEWKVEQRYQPTAISLSKSEKLLFVGLSNGTIRIYTLPLAPEGYIDIPAHGGPVRRLIPSNDDVYLASIGESAYVLLFKYKPVVGNNRDIDHFQCQIEQQQRKDPSVTSLLPKFHHILVTKAEFDEQNRKLFDTELRINEVQTENDLRLRSKQIQFSKHLNYYQNHFETQMKQLYHQYEKLKSETQDNICKYNEDGKQLRQQYETIEAHAEAVYENITMNSLRRIQSKQHELKRLKSVYEKKLEKLGVEEQADVQDVVNKANTLLNTRWRCGIKTLETIQQHENEINAYIRQMEQDIDDEVENVKDGYLRELATSEANSKRLIVSVSTLRKRYNAIVVRMESRDVEKTDLQTEVKELHDKQFELTDHLNHFYQIIKKKEDRIGTHDVKLHRLQHHILHVEKRKYVLDYKTKSLLERIEPIDQEINRLKQNSGEIEQQLTLLKRQQKELISREKDYEYKLHESRRDLKTAQKMHKKLWRIVKRQKELVKKSLKLTEITCTTRGFKEDLEHFVKEMCDMLRREQIFEHQIEIHGFLKEWTHQRGWLLNQMHDLTKRTELAEQFQLRAQREHRKIIAPFAQQLDELHRIFDTTQKHIQKRLFNLKIKTSEQVEFLRQVSETIHGNEKLHMSIEKVRQVELHVEMQEKEIERLSSIVFRFQYCQPCLDVNKKILGVEMTTTTPLLAPLPEILSPLNV